MHQESLVLFVLSAMAVSLSGVMSPGPMTAAAIERGGSSPLNGFYISLGHGLVEVPLIAALYFGASRFFESGPTRIFIGVAGGLYLLYMAKGLITSPAVPGAENNTGQKASSSILTGAALSAANPYFLLWWATVGLGLVIGAEKFGAIGVAVFVIAHWLCDLVWFSLLGALSYKGSKALGAGFFRWVSIACGTILVFFGGYFIYNAVMIATGA